MVEVAKLEDIELKEVWPHEGADFTPWLAENPEQLSELLGMDLELEGTEVPVGPFSADVVFRDQNTGHRIVVENMLNATDHDHLGKLITYAAGVEAHWAVLVAKSFRAEHRSALNWLNSLSGEESGFFGIEVRAVCIEGSRPAALLDVVVEPDHFARAAHTSSSEPSATQSNYRAWWKLFFETLRETHPGWSSATASQINWCVLPSGVRGIGYELRFAWPAGFSSQFLRASVQFYDNADAFEALCKQRSEIEAATDLELTWDPLDDSKFARIWTSLGDTDSNDREQWPEYRARAIEALSELRRVFEAPIKELQ